MEGDRASLLGSSSIIDGLIVSSIDDDLLLVITDRELAILKSRVLTELMIDDNFRKLLKERVTAIANRLKSLKD